MKKFLVVLIVVVMVMAIAAPVMAHPKGPDSMPNQAARGLHEAYYTVADFFPAGHVIVGLMLRLDGPCPHPVP